MKNILPVLIVLLCLAACSTVSVNHQGEIPAPAQGPVKATFSWLEQSVPGNDIRVNNPTIDTMVRQSVKRHLQAKGYEEVEAGEADYLLTWFGTIDEEVKEISLASYYSRGGYVSLLGTMPEKVEGGKVRKTFARGTLIIDVLDRRSREVLWRGSATNTLGEEMSKKRIAEYIDTSVARILATLP